MKKEKIKQFLASRSGKSAVAIVALLLIGAAVYLNYRLFYDPTAAIGYGSNNMADQHGNSTQTGAETTEKSYFSATALTRQQSRDEAIDVLKLVADDDEATAEAKAEASNKISKIAVDIQNEANIESLVKAKGFEECVAIIGDDSVSVIVHDDDMQANEAAQILAIVYETTGISPEKISIINK